MSKHWYALRPSSPTRFPSPDLVPVNNSTSTIISISLSISSKPSSCWFPILSSLAPD